jgi:putative transposase
MCAVLTEHGIKISPSTYYEWTRKTPSKQQLRDEAVTASIKEFRERNPLNKTLGSRKVWIKLRGEGMDVARCTVERLMQANRLGGCPLRWPAQNDHPGREGPAGTDLVDRVFAAPAPNRLRVADFTYCPTWAGMVYVAFVIDAFARRVIGWRAATSMKTALVLDALEHAFFTRAQEGFTELSGLVAHSDAGSQYTSIAFTTRLIDAGVDASVGSVADAYDNALAETTVGSFKNELIRRQGPWRDVDHVEIGTLNWVDWFNNERLHEYLADLTPADAEALHYRHKSSLATVG